MKIKPAFSFRDVLNVHNIIAISGLLSNSFENRVFMRRNFHLRHIDILNIINFNFILFYIVFKNDIIKKNPF